MEVPGAAARVLVAAVLVFAGACGGDGESGQPDSRELVVPRRVDAGAYPIVYSRVVDDSLDLYRAEMTGDSVPFVEGSRDLAMAEWSPDGHRLAFVAFEDVEAGPADIYVVDADGSHLRLLTPNDDCAQSPSWSPDGQELVYVGGPCGEQPAMVAVDSEGGEPRRLVDVPVAWPDWGPDGRIAFESYRPGTSDAAFFVTRRDGTSPTQVDTGQVPSGSEPSWSPDGREIAYIAGTGDPASANPSDWNEDVFVIDAAGTRGRRIVAAPGNDHWPPAWSPDGQQLIYTNDGVDNESTTLMLVDVRTRDIRRLFRDECECLFADWRS